MSTINAKVKSVRVANDADNVWYHVEFDTSFDAIVKQNGEFVEAQANYINFVPRVLIAQCLDVVDGLDYLYTKKKEQGIRADGVSGFGAAELNLVLRGATIEMEREKVEAGTEYTDKDGQIHTREHDGYNTSITNINVTERIQAKLDAAIDKALGL